MEYLQRHYIIIYMASQVAQWSRICLPMQEMQVLYLPGSERSPGEGKGNPLQCSCLGNPMGRGVLGATVHGLAKEPDIT